MASRVSSSAGHIGSAAEKLGAAIEATDTRITARFDLEKARGTLPADFPSAGQAKVLSVLPKANHWFDGVTARRNAALRAAHTFLVECLRF